VDSVVSGVGCGGAVAFVCLFLLMLQLFFLVALCCDIVVWLVQIASSPAWMQMNQSYSPP